MVLVMEPGERIFTTWMTFTDGADHAVTDEEFTENRPEPETVCGVVELLAPMETPPGPRCPQCAAYLAARQTLRDLDQRMQGNRHTRPGWLSRLLHSTNSAPATAAVRARRRDRAPLPASVSPAGAGSNPLAARPPTSGQRAAEVRHTPGVTSAAPPARCAP
jgi:hypothetical protein